MSTTYLSELDNLVATKLSFNDIYFLSLTSTQWVSFLSKDFWLTNFISTFGSKLLNQSKYELWYEVYYKLPLLKLLKLSVKYQHYDLTFKLVIKFKAGVDFSQLLIYASSRGNLSIIKFLLAEGADIHAQEDDALMYAAYYDHLDIVEFLLANGADIHAQEDWALRYAASRGHLDVVKFLLANEADIHAQEDRALIYATYGG